MITALVAILVLSGCGPAGSTASTPSPSDTDNGVLAALADSCTGGGFIACDVLYVVAAGNQPLRELGDTCGGNDEPSGWCVELHDVVIDPGALSGDCGDGDMFACDALYAYSPLGSDDEQFGWSCGDRVRTTSTCITERNQIPPA